MCFSHLCQQTGMFFILTRELWKEHLRIKDVKFLTLILVSFSFHQWRWERYHYTPSLKSVKLFSYLESKRACLVFKKIDISPDVVNFLKASTTCLVRNNMYMQNVQLSSFWCLFCSPSTYFSPFSRVSVVDFEQLNVLWIKLYTVLHQNLPSRTLQVSSTVKRKKRRLMASRWDFFDIIVFILSSWVCRPSFPAFTLVFFGGFKRIN